MRSPATRPAAHNHLSTAFNSWHCYSRSPLFCANAGMKSAPSPGGRSGCTPVGGCAMPCNRTPGQPVDVLSATLPADVLLRRLSQPDSEGLPALVPLQMHLCTRCGTCRHLVWRQGVLHAKRRQSAGNPHIQPMARQAHPAELHPRVAIAPPHTPAVQMCMFGHEDTLIPASAC